MTTDSQLTTKLKQITELLNNSGSVLIATHEYPDADGLGSALAVKRLCDLRGIRAFVYTPGTPQSNLSFLPGIEEVRNELNGFSFELALCLDYGDFVRLRFPESLDIKTLVTIDHHPASSHRGDVVLLAPQFSSTAEIVYWWFKWAGFPIDKQIAACLLTGIVGDTGGFRHNSTSATTFRAAGDLVARGAPIYKIMRRATALQGNYSVSGIVGRALARVEVEPKSGLAYSWIGRDEIKSSGQHTFDMHELPTIVATASPVNFGLLLTQEEGNLVRGSLRAEPYSGRDVNALARLLGGGGHKYAAGFRYQGTIKETLQRVLELV